jgi:hypothetical protein
MAVVADWATAWQRSAMASPSMLSRAHRPSTRAAPWACASACVVAWMAVASTSARAPPSGLRWTHKGTAARLLTASATSPSARRVAERLHAGRQSTAALRQHPLPLLAARYRGAAPWPSTAHIDADAAAVSRVLGRSAARAMRQPISTAAARVMRRQPVAPPSTVRVSPPCSSAAHPGRPLPWSASPTVRSGAPGDVSMGSRGAGVRGACAPAVRRPALRCRRVRCVWGKKVVPQVGQKFGAPPETRTRA